MAQDDRGVRGGERISADHGGKATSDQTRWLCILEISQIYLETGNPGNYKSSFIQPIPFILRKTIHSLDITQGFPRPLTTEFLLNDLQLLIDAWQGPFFWSSVKSV